MEEESTTAQEERSLFLAFPFLQIKSYQLGRGKRSRRRGNGGAGCVGLLLFAAIEALGSEDKRNFVENWRSSEHRRLVPRFLQVTSQRTLCEEAWVRGACRVTGWGSLSLAVRCRKSSRHLLCPQTGPRSGERGQRPQHIWEKEEEEGFQGHRRTLSFRKKPGG